MATPTRLYAVIEKATNDRRLIDAGNPSQALRHVIRERFTVEPASPRSVADLVGSGVKIEHATAADAE